MLPLRQKYYKMQLTKSISFIIENLTSKDKDIFLKELLLSIHHENIFHNSEEIRNLLLDWEETAVINLDTERKEKIMQRFKNLV